METAAQPVKLNTIHIIACSMGNTSGYNVPVYAQRKTEARTVSGFIDIQFVLLLILFEDLFQVKKFMSDQSPSLKLSFTMDLTDSVIVSLSDKCAEESWREICDRATDLCTTAGVSQSGTPERRQAQPPTGVRGRGPN